ncbi:MAG: SCO family protein, partial [Nevskiaceae bacterium]
FAASRLYGTRVAPALAAGTMLSQPRAVAPFTLTDQDGQPFTAAQLRGHWTLLFAGFTHCPDICPTTLALMAQLRQRLAAAPGTLQLLFLSVDPERDSPEQLKAYTAHFGGGIRGVTAPRAQLDAFCASLGLAYLKVPGAGPGDYTVDHSAALVLLDPQGRIAAYFQAPHRLDTLAADLSRIVGT